MSVDKALPCDAQNHLAGLKPVALIDLMRADEDRVPRAVIDACVRHDEAMVEVLADLVEHPWPEEEAHGTWWLRLHAVMILGLIASERAGLLLLHFMRRMSEADDTDLQDWLAGYWPALFANKPDCVLAALRELCEDRALDWYIRANAMEPVVATARLRSPQALEEALAWVAQIAADEEESWELRLSCGNMLLDFPRSQFRTLLEHLAKRQTGFGVHFSADEVERAYAALEDAPDWRSRDDPWAFYRPEAIAARQERWAQENAASSYDACDIDDSLISDEPPLPYVRAAPKVGRNDLCPCGSGKKYKKCCLGREEGNL
ncbi:MAG TPA: SEC-C metal-binding domain-containing protein [Burkholderiales bacterium]|nr:SEC-C metal-binding domain-containing protein [Burkholderiales bacterium]